MIIRKLMQLPLALLLILALTFVPAEYGYCAQDAGNTDGKADRPARTVRKVKGRYCYFNAKGKIGKAKKERLVKCGGKTYSVRKNGTTRAGWQTYGKHLYYFAAPDGAMVTNKTVSGIRLQANGKAYMSLDASIRYRCIEDLKKITDLDRKKSTQLRAVWKYMSSRKFRYSTKTYPKKGDKSWPKTIAYKTLSTRRGNCYGFACAFAAYAETIGYDPQVVAGRCPGWRDRASDGYTRHCVVRINKRWYDPEANNIGWSRGIYARKSLKFSFKSRKYHRFRDIPGTQKTGLVTASGGKANYSRTDDRYYGYGPSGKAIKGYQVIDGKLFNFRHKDKGGYYMTLAEFNKLKKKTKKGASFEKLKAVIGKPLSAEDGCDIGRKTFDRVYFYRDFNVVCRVTFDGSTITVSRIQSKE